MLADLRHAWRALRRSPGYLAAAVLTLALGIGATTALFGVVDRVLLRPLPYREPARLVRVWDRAMANALYDRVRAGARGFAAVAGVTYPSDASALVRRAPARRCRCASRARPRPATCSPRSAPAPPLGRTLRPDDAAPARRPWPCSATPSGASASAPTRAPSARRSSSTACATRSWA
jgi:hypothetical protein